ncbi:MAG TPA: hypothetical protein PLP13_06530 [bacterium]|nr:hypothetical protein [bacterium]
MMVPGILDSHVHFNSIDKIKETKDFFTSCNIDRFCIVSPASPSGGNSNPQALCFKATYPSETYIMGGLDYSNVMCYSTKERRKVLKPQLMRMLAIGFDGVKILETDDEFYMPEGDANVLSEKDRIIIGIKLPVSVLEKIYKKNFQHIVGKKPKPIDIEKAIKESGRISGILTRQFNVRKN